MCESAIGRNFQVEAIGGECDDTAARRSWDAHLQRNDSFVVDTMHGQYKSVRVIVYIWNFSGVVDGWMQRPRSKAAAGTNLKFLVEHTLEVLVACAEVDVTCT